MDDPIFDPWSRKAEAPTSEAARVRRWRAVAPQTPTVPATTPAPLRVRSSVAKTRLPGTPGFLRTMAVPRLQDIVQRLVMARHWAMVEDLLDEVPSRVLVRVRPWQSPMAQPRTVEGTLELRILNDDRDRVSLRYTCRDADEEWTDEDGIATARLTSTWLDSRILGFVRQVLDRA